LLLAKKATPVLLKEYKTNYDVSCFLPKTYITRETATVHKKKDNPIYHDLSSHAAVGIVFNNQLHEFHQHFPPTGCYN